MRTLLKIVIIIISISLAKFEIGACPGQCIGNWNYSTTPLSADTLGCGILVHYKWRECQINGNTIREVQITRIDKIVGGNCDNLLIRTLVGLAAKAVLFYSSGIFMVEDPTAPYVVDLNIPACWKEADGGQYGLVSCDDNLCCTKKVTMQTVNSLPQAVEVQPTIPPNPPNCSGIVGQNCDYTCEDINIPTNEPLIPWHFDYNWLCQPDCNSTPQMKGAYFNYSGNYVFVGYVVLTNCTESGVCSKVGVVTKRHQVTRIQIVHLNNNINSSYEYIFQGLKKSICHYMGVLGENDYKVKVFVHQCWKLFNLDDYSAYPCNPPSECCYRYFYFQRNPQKSVCYPVGKCPATIYEPDNCGVQICSYGCNWLFICPNLIPWSYCDMLNDDWNYLKQGMFEPEDQSLKLPASSVVSKEIISENFSFTIISNKSKNVKIQIFDMMGNLVLAKEISLNEGQNIVRLNESNPISNGMNFYNITNGKEFNAYGKFVYLK